MAGREGAPLPLPRVVDLNGSFSGRSGFLLDDDEGSYARALSPPMGAS